MLCQICKINLATIHIQEVIGSEKKTLHLCAECAEKKALDSPILKDFNLPEMIYNLTHNLPAAAETLQKEIEKTQILNMGSSAPGGESAPDGGGTGTADEDEDPALEKEDEEEPEEEEEEKEEKKKDGQVVVCPYCFWDSLQLKKTGRMGCPKCYDVFRESLSGLLLQMHRGKRHTGKRPFPFRGTGKGSAAEEEFRTRTALRKEIAKQEKNLKESIRREEYELAAELRDKILKLKLQLEPLSRKEKEEEPGNKSERNNA